MKLQFLKQISGTVIITLLVSSLANAQIVYTNVIPDSTIGCFIVPCTKEYNLDLNNDHIVDFVIGQSNFVPQCTSAPIGRMVFITPVAGGVVTSRGYPSKLGR